MEEWGRPWSRFGGQSNRYMHWDVIGPVEETEREEESLNKAAMWKGKYISLDNRFREEMLKHMVGRKRCRRGRLRRMNGSGRRD